ncbi:MAG: sigma-70 family RNA polymerase sigma factor [Anaerostipes sp.]|nr:sigma-70 family RNA polymerase sigma factor [Anaerostipes sp.]
MKINKLIEKIQVGDKEAANQLMIAMEPLIKKYSAKVYSMEFDDAYQELSIALMESIKYIRDTSNENACLSYLKKTIIHKKIALYKKYKCIVEEEVAWDNDKISNLSTISYISDVVFSLDFTSFLEALPQKERLILELIYYKGFGDAEIAKEIGASRQYINRIKKKIAQKADFLENK